MVTVVLIHQLGPYEACSRQANGAGYAWADNDAWDMLFPGVPPGDPQEITSPSGKSVITVATPGAGVPPWVKW